jgi:hypothetical protein
MADRFDGAMMAAIFAPAGAHELQARFQSDKSAAVV